MDVSISIVSYNTKNLILRCIESIYKYTRGITYEVIVIDNGSRDGTVSEIEKRFPKVKLIKNKTNEFFTKANNKALKIAKGRYFLVLNSDTYFIDNSLKKFVLYMDPHKNVGASEGLEIYEDGRFVPTGSRFSDPLTDFYELSLIGRRIADKKRIAWYRITSEDRANTFNIDVGCDAFLIVRKDLLEQIGGYDENFLLYYTENDLCARIKKEGYEITHFGKARVMHRVSATAKKLGWKKTDIYYRDLFSYYKKYGHLLSGGLLFLILKSEELLLKTISIFK